MRYDPDNLLADFARRTLLNLEHIDRLYDEETNCDKLPEERSAFPVTQLINSLLGLVVFPKENYGKSIPDKTLAELIGEGWPRLQIFYPSPACEKEPHNHKRCDSLKELVRVLRNGTSHFNVKFENSSAEQIEWVTFSNRCRACKELTTSVRLDVDQVRDIAQRYARLIIDYSERRVVQTK